MNHWRMGGKAQTEEGNQKDATLQFYRKIAKAQRYLARLDKQLSIRKYPYQTQETR